MNLISFKICNIHIAHNVAMEVHGLLKRNREDCLAAHISLPVYCGRGEPGAGGERSRRVLTAGRHGWPGGSESQSSSL